MAAFGSPRAATAADGYMIRVIADRGEIKLGQKVLARVPKGTRLWAFSVNDKKWANVKVPGSDDKGWLHNASYERVTYSGKQLVLLREAAKHYERDLDLEEETETCAKRSTK